METSSVTAVHPPGSRVLGHRKLRQAGYPGGKCDEATSRPPAQLLVYDHDMGKDGKSIKR